MTDKEINEAVARKMGWKSVEGGGWISPNEIPYIHGDFIPDYSHSIEAAWEILKFVDAWKLEGYGGDEVTVSLALDSNPIADESADTSPMAICLAFLKLP